MNMTVSKHHNKIWRAYSFIDFRVNNLCYQTEDLLLLDSLVTFTTLGHWIAYNAFSSKWVSLEIPIELLPEARLQHRIGCGTLLHSNF